MKAQCCGLPTFSAPSLRSFQLLMLGHLMKARVPADVMFLGSTSYMLTTSADKTARLWSSDSTDGSGPYVPGATLTDHTAEITCASLHATRKYFVTASLDRTWAFYDVENALCYTQVGRALWCPRRLSSRALSSRQPPPAIILCLQDVHI